MTRGRHLQPEKAIQQQGVNLLRQVGSAVYVLGTHRRRGDHQGTMQTPGIGDVYAFVPVVLPVRAIEALWWEAKAPGGRLRVEQRAFREQCLRAGVAHVVGDLDALIAWLVTRGVVKLDSFAHYRQAGIQQHLGGEHASKGSTDPRSV